MQFLRDLIAKLQARQTYILRFIAACEIFLMPALIFMTFRYFQQYISACCLLYISSKSSIAVAVKLLETVSFW